MKKTKLLLAFLTSVLLLSLLCAFSASAEKEFRGGIERVDLTIDKPMSGQYFDVDASEEDTKYHVGTFDGDSVGVRWFDVTQDCYVKSPKYSYYKYGTAKLLDVYRVEILVEISGSIIVGDKVNYAGMFRAYGEGDDWTQAVVATVNGQTANVSPYRDRSIGECLLISYTFKETLPEDPDTQIRVLECQIDAPRGGRKAVFTPVSVCGYQKHYTVDKITWTDATTGIDLSEGDVFVTGHDYKVSVLFKSWGPAYSLYPEIVMINGIMIYDTPYYGNDQKVTAAYTFTNVREAPTDYVSVQVYGLMVPVAGFSPEEYPAMRVTCDESAGSNVEIPQTSNPFYHNGVRWAYSDDGSILDKEDKFQKGVSYTLVVPVRTTGDNRFALDSEGKSILWATYIPDFGEAAYSTDVRNYDDRPDLDVEIFIEFPPCKEFIDADAFSFTVQTPKEGETINKSVTPEEGSKYGGKNGVWIDDTANRVMSAGDKFVADHHYTFQFETYVLQNGSYLLPAGYGSTSCEGASIKVNGNYGGVIEYKANYTGKDAPWYSFIVNVDMGICNDSVIEEIALKIAPPVPGELPQYFAINQGSGYKIANKEGKDKWSGRYYMRSGVQWIDLDSNAEYTYEDEPFIEGHRYMVRINIDAESGYEFYHNKDYRILATASVNGSPADVEDNGFNNVYHQRITYTFVCSAPETSYTVYASVYTHDAPETPVTITLLKAGTLKKLAEKTEYGYAVNIGFTPVNPGSYILKVTKEGYATLTKEVAVIDSNVSINEELVKAAVLYGDANGDKKVSSSDIVRLKKYFASLDPDTGLSSVEISPGGDANGDGKISSSDIVRLKKYFASLDPDTGVSSVKLGPDN